VALLLLRRLTTAKVVGIEAYGPHHELAMRNAALNGLTERYDARYGDLREPRILNGEAPFDLICGAPPYLPVGSGILPKNPGRAVGRFELRGGVEAYAAMAVRHLAEGAPVVLLMDGRGPRPRRVGRQCRGPFRLHSDRCPPAAGAAPTYWLIEAGTRYFGTPVEEEVCMRLAAGMEWSPAYAAIRELLDLPRQDSSDRRIAPSSRFCGAAGEGSMPVYIASARKPGGSRSAGQSASTFTAAWFRICIRCFGLFLGTVSEARLCRVSPNCRRPRRAT